MIPAIGRARWRDEPGYDTAIVALNGVAQTADPSPTNQDLRMLKRAIKASIFLLSGLLAVSVLLVLALIIFNLFDEEIDPEVERILASSEPDIPPSQNAFFSMLAITAPSGENIHSAGRKLATEYRANADRVDAKEQATPTDSFGDESLEFVGDFNEICYPRDGPPCLKFCCASELALAEAMKVNQKLLSRYESLYRFRTYYDTASALLVPNDVLTIHRLKLAQIADAHASGDTTGALQSISRDIGFWRGILTSEMNAIVHTVVGLAISNNLNLLSEIMLTNRLSDSDWLLIDEILSPLTKAEKSIEGVMIAELRQWQNFNRHLDDNIEQLAPGIESPTLRKIAARTLYSPVATLNFGYAQFKKAIRNLESLPHPANSAHWEAEEELGIADYFYNPIGKVLTDWIGRFPAALNSAHRADARYRLVALQAKLLRAKVPESQVSEFLLTAPEYFSNPFTGEKIIWESTEQRLAIHVPNPRYTDRIWINYKGP